LPLLLVPALHLSSESGAQAQSVNAVAEQLFRDGRALLEAGKVDDACDKLAASLRLSPALGTQLNLALCLERQGRTATAWSMFADVESAALRSGDPARARLAQHHEAVLAGKLKKVVIEVPSPPAGMLVKLDGNVLPSGALGTEIPLDPGSHNLTVTAPGRKTWEQTNMELGPSATTVHVRVELEEPPPPPPAETPAPVVAAPPPLIEPVAPPAVPEAAGGADPTNPARTTADAASAAQTKRTIGFATGGAGILALGLGTYYAITAATRKSDESKYPAGSADQRTVSDQAKTAETWAYLFGGVGVAATAAGLYLVLTSHPPAPTPSLAIAPTFGPQMTGATLRGTF
jgi:hypothetical protein